jgi:hypothetical protein
MGFDRIEAAHNMEDFAPEIFPTGRQPDAAVGPVKKLNPKFALQVADLSAQRGLGDEQTPGGPAEMEFFGEDPEVL